MNFLALLGWSYDDHTTVMSPARADRALLARARRPEPGDVRLREARLAERRLPARALDPSEYARVLLVAGSREQGIDWPEERVRATVPLVQEKIEKLSPVPRLRPLPVRAGQRRRRRSGDVRAAAYEALTPVDPWEAPAIEAALRALAERSARSRARPSGRCGSPSPARRSRPGLFESLELLGKDESLARLAAVA